MSSRNTSGKHASSKTTNPKSASRSTTSKRKTPSKPSRSAVAQNVESQTAATSTMANDITGIIIAVVAVALFVAVVLPSGAIVAQFASDCLLLGFGVGAYILPVVLLIWAATFFINHKPGSISRTGLGLGLILIAILTLLALYTPFAASYPKVVFDQAALVSRGGYLGAGLAYALLICVGQIIGMIISIGVIITGIVVLGFSISSMVQRAQERAELARATHEADRELKRGATPRTERIAAGEDERERRGRRDAGETRRLRGMDSDKTMIMDDAPDQEITRELRHEPRKRKDLDETIALDTDAEQTVPLKRTSSLEGFELPPERLLLRTTQTTQKKQERAISRNLSEMAQRLQDTLESFNLFANVVGYTPGPTFTLFKIEMPTGVKLTRITSLEDDIALALASESVRIFAPIPGTSLVGVEIPNKTRAAVLLGDIIDSVQGGPLELVLGKNVEGESVTADLAKMPHLLIGGTTGSGKSVAINAMLMTILMRDTPEDVRMILIDPKRVELSLYNGIPHLYVPVVTDPKEAAATLAWATIEMERRLKLFEKAGTRNLELYNGMIADGRLSDDNEKLPYIVVVIDELSDLMMVAGKEVEGSIVRIAQLARAAGIHLIVATQRPSSNVVTGMIKTNISNRIAFKVPTGVDSRVILDQTGAENLVGMGDLLFLNGNSGEPQRVQGCYVGETETNAVVEFLRSQGEPDYHEEIFETRVIGQGSSMNPNSPDGEDEDPMLWDAAEVVVQTQMGSTSSLQRRMKVGYARAGRIMDQLEMKGVVGPSDGSHPREVLVENVVDLEALRSLDDYESGKESDS